VGGSIVGDRSSEPIRAIIVHDHRMLAEGLRNALDAELGIEVVGLARTLEEAESFTRTMHPDVALIERAIFDGDETRCAGPLRQWHPALKLLLLAGPGDTGDFGANAITAGFDGVLHRGAGLFEAVHAVRRLADGGAVFALHELTAALDHARSRAERRPCLSDREAEVFELLAQGKSTTQMAATLFISPHTIRSHIARILTKLDAHSKCEAIAIGYQRKLIPPP